MTGDDVVSRVRSVIVESSRGGFVKVTHREARCCSGSWACSPTSEHLFSTELYQQASGPFKRKEKKCI